jgi:hypothetical protein
MTRSEPARARPFTLQLIQRSTLVTVSFLCVDIWSRRLDEAASFTLRCILERLGPAQSLRLCGAAYGRSMLVRKIVDVFVRDTLKGSYPVVVECQGRSSEDEFVDQVRKRMDRGFYSADDIKVAKFVVREAGGGKRV